jgi:hypothetical protein
MPTARFATFLRNAIAALAAGACIAAAAATPPPALPGGAALGMSLAQLQQVQPALKRVPRPARLAGGLLGSWSAEAVDAAGIALTPTYFFGDGELQRVEYLASRASPDAFAALLAWGRGNWGAELAANDPDGAYASWSHDDIDAYVQLANTAHGAQLRLVVKRRVLKEAGEL